MWIKIRDLIRSVTKKSDDKLPLNKAIEIPIVLIAVRAIFYENNKYYSQVFKMNSCINYN